tara:strand:+ start:152 stop:424 length:273 start_codon:yes stop_codon:yes gene_type:complete
MVVEEEEPIQICLVLVMAMHQVLAAAALEILVLGDPVQVVLMAILVDRKQDLVKVIIQLPLEVAVVQDLVVEMVYQMVLEELVEMVVPGQ